MSKVKVRAKTKMNPHWGSTLDDFLDEEGIREAAKAAAVTRVVAWQLSEEMKRLDYLLDRPTLDPERQLFGKEIQARIATACPQRRRDHEDGKDRDRSHSANPAGSVDDA